MYNYTSVKRSVCKFIRLGLEEGIDVRGYRVTGDHGLSETVAISFQIMHISPELLFRLNNLNSY